LRSEPQNRSADVLFSTVQTDRLQPDDCEVCGAIDNI